MNQSRCRICAPPSSSNLRRTMNMGCRSAGKFFAWFAVLLLAATGLRAQSIITGAVSGTVTDPAGAILPDATVTLTNTATADIQNGKTNTSGVYLFPLLKPGDYTVTVQESGFRVAVAKVTVTFGRTASAGLKVETGDTAQRGDVIIGGV